MNSNHKSKAFIITFVSVLILLVAGYFLFYKDSGTTKGTLANRMFAPLLGTSKPKTLPTVKTPDTTVNTPTTTPDTTVNTPVVIPGGNNNTGSNILPAFNPLPSPTNPNECRNASGKIIPCPTNNVVLTNGSECSDKIDNDNDGLIDEKDDGCHTDYNADNANSYDKNIGSESRKNPNPIVENQCPEGNPVKFTAAEQAALDALLAEYYNIAAKLKTEADIQALKDAGVEYNNLIAQSDSLEKDCREQKADPAYTGPQVVKNNPYYQDPANPKNTGAYLAEETVDPLGKLIETAIKYHPNGSFGTLGGDIDPAYTNCTSSITHPCTGSAVNPVYANLDTFFTNWNDFENLFGIW